MVETGKVEFIKKARSKEEIKREMHPYLAEWFEEAFGDFSGPQKEAIMNIHLKRNTLVCAPTGSGKTLAAFTSILSELSFLEEAGQLENRVYCVYVSPLKALNNDIEKNLLEPLKWVEARAKRDGKKIEVRTGIRTGDTSAGEKAKMLERAPHILITTPESLALVLVAPKFREMLKGVKWAIVDEIHALASSKRGAHLSLSLERLQNMSGEEMTRIGLSATIHPIEQIAGFLVGSRRECGIVKTEMRKELDLKVMAPGMQKRFAKAGETREEIYEAIAKLVMEHKTTLIFTNTRSATETIVHELKSRLPKEHVEDVGAHHGSLSRETRREIEDGLKSGKLKAVVSSTSLELGIDIGHIDLVILVSSPKSVTRALQRFGRAGHKLHAKIKGVFVAVDRDDLVECAVIAKMCRRGTLDCVEIPENCLDVLAQQVVGMSVEEGAVSEEEAFELARKSWCYRNLERRDFNAVVKYLAGKFYSLESRRVYAKVWVDEERGKIVRKKGARMIYSTNIGTIPDQAMVKVKAGERLIGEIDEGFLEKMRKGDLFVLGGKTHEYLYARGMTAFVSPRPGKEPTIPSWYSEMLPLSFEAAREIGAFRRYLAGLVEAGESAEKARKFAGDFLEVDEATAKAIYSYFKMQEMHSIVPHEKRILVEISSDEHGNKFVVVHSMHGRRVNDVLSRCLAWFASKKEGENIAIGLNDNGFFLAGKKTPNFRGALELLKESDLETAAKKAIGNTAALKKRYRYCAGRALMILRNYGGRRSAGRQQVSADILYAATRGLGSEFPILKEAEREVLEEMMDIERAKSVLEEISSGKIKIAERQESIPSPFAFKLLATGYADVITGEEKQDFLKKMHSMVLARIALKKERLSQEERELLEEQMGNYWL